MDIRIGDVVGFRIKFYGKYKLGTVVEIEEVKESIESKRKGYLLYEVDTYGDAVNNITLEENEIEKVYRNIESEVE